MQKQTILNDLKSMIKNQTNTTRANALNTMTTITENYLSNAKSYEIRLTGEKQVNIGDLAERIVFEYLAEKYGAKPHDNINADYDAKIDGEKIEIKSVVNANSGKLKRPLKTFVLLLQGKHQGIYYIDERKAKILVGIRISRDIVEQFGTQVESLNELIVR